jgi:hypothetical protein
MDMSAYLDAGGTTLQLAGSLITLGGLVWAWYTATGWRLKTLGAFGTRLKNLRTAVHEILVPPPAEINLQGDRPIVPISGKLSGHGDLAVVAEALDANEKRLNALEHAAQSWQANSQQ